MVFDGMRDNNTCSEMIQAYGAPGVCGSTNYYLQCCETCEKLAADYKAGRCIDIFMVKNILYF